MPCCAVQCWSWNHGSSLEDGVTRFTTETLHCRAGKQLGRLIGQLEEAMHMLYGMTFQMICLAICLAATLALVSDSRLPCATEHGCWQVNGKLTVGSRGSGGSLRIRLAKGHRRSKISASGLGPCLARLMLPPGVSFEHEICLAQPGIM